MAITVQMIENKEFSTAPMGYKRKEVDMFLDEICDEMDRMTEEIQTLQLKLSQASQSAGTASFRNQRAAGRPAATVPAPLEAEEEPAEPEAPAEKAPEPRKEPLRPDISTEATALLRTAQRVYDETIRDAKDEAKRIVDEAQAKVDDQFKLQQKERDEMDEALHTLRASAAEYKRKLQNLLNSQQKLLDDAAGLFEEEEPTT